MTEEAQARYEHMWEDLLRVGTAMSMRLCKNPWMAKVAPLADSRNPELHSHQCVSLDTSPHLHF
jgi:hypothetical protein